MEKQYLPQNVNPLTVQFAEAVICSLVNYSPATGVHTRDKTMSQGDMYGSKVGRTIGLMVLNGVLATAALSIWGWALGGAVIPWTISGAIVGALFGIWDGVSQAAKLERGDYGGAMTGGGAFFLPFAVLVAIVGVVVGVIRAIF
jgi:hypothetical protein